MSRHARLKTRKDANHAEILEFFRAAGAIVEDVSALSGLGFDLVVSFGGAVVMVEVKDGSKPPSKRQLTESEKAAQQRWGDKYSVIESIEQAKGLLDSMAYYGRLG